MSYSVWTDEGKRQKFSLLHQSKGMMEQAKLSTEIASKRLWLLRVRQEQFMLEENILSPNGLTLDGTRFTCRGRQIYHLYGTSTFTEYTVRREIAVGKIDAAAPKDKVCIISCEVPTGFGPMFNTAKVMVLESCHLSYGVHMIIGVALSNAQLSFDPMLIFSGRTIKGDVMGDHGHQIVGENAKENCFTAIESGCVAPQEMRDEAKKLTFEVEYYNDSHVAIHN
eukprot:bmy_16085T0